MMILPIFLALMMASVIFGQHNSSATLDKAPLQDNLDYLRQGLIESLPETDYHYDRWISGWIPQDCKNIVEGDANSLDYSPADFEVYDVYYADCASAWIFCHHKDSPITFDSMARQFGKVPIQMRQWVRHVIDVPADHTWAFEWDSSVTFLSPTDDMLPVILHETAHSLDLSGAYAEKPFSSSDNWWNSYDQDCNVPDTYAQTNAVEDVAQNTVIAVFDVNVEGGYKSVEPQWRNVSHQYTSLLNEAESAGQGNSLFKYTKDAQCTDRVPSSQPVSIDGSSSRKRNTKARRQAPKVDLVGYLNSLSAGRKSGDKHSGCTLQW